MRRSVRTGDGDDRTEIYLRSYPELDGLASYAARVEEDGWDGLLFTDTQNLSMDVFAALYVSAMSTSQLKLGTAVTNLTTRHPAVVASAFATLHDVSGGRAHIGVGRGDTALKLLGIRPPSAEQFQVQLSHLQSYLRGEAVDVDGFPSRLTWLPLEGQSKVPVNVFGSGPRVVGIGAAQADMVTVTVGAELDSVKHAVSTARDAHAGSGAGELSPLKVGAFVVVAAGTNPEALEVLVRGNASVSAHFQRNALSSLDDRDAQVVRQVSDTYDTYRHGLVHAAQSDSLPLDFLHRFCVIGTPDECIDRLNRLIALGLSHLIVVGGSRDIDRELRQKSDHLIAMEVLPSLRRRSHG
nr:LLM class flavin-dependent oxidoreductase [Mycolicibacterium sphagni]